MLTENQIKSLLGSISDKLKNANSGYKKNGHGYKSCDWCEGYKEAVEFAEAICVHAEMGKFPEKLMVAKAPNETPEELQYRKDVFESITVPYFHRAENSLNRIWAEQNYKIDFGDEDAKKYYTKDYPIYNSLISYFQSVVTKQKIRDPNSVLCLDFDLPLKEISEGEYVVDQSEQIEPYATLYDSDDVLMFEVGDMALFMSEEKSEVEYSNGKKRMGYVLYLYDDTNIYRIEQTGKYVDYTFNINVYYSHNLGYLPAWKLRGIPYEVYADNPIYQSYFVGALPYLNQALKLSSTLDLSINKIAYPTRVYYSQKCNAKGCRDGFILDGVGEPSKCQACKGTGQLKFSPLRDYIQEPPTPLDDTGSQLPFPALTYVSPDTAILTFNKEKIQEDIVAAFKFINIDVTNEATSNGTEQTATEIRINRDEFYAFLLTISNELFGLLENFINAANKVRYNESEIVVTVSPPKTFELVTPAELTQELSTAGLPATALQQLTRDYLVSRFTQNGDLSKTYKIIEIVDPYAAKSTTDIIALKSAGVIQLYQAILHEEILSYIADEVAKDRGFWVG